MIGPGVTIGDDCKIQNNVSLYDGVELEDGVFCGPCCVFTNVNNPRAEIERKAEFRAHAGQARRDHRRQCNHRLRPHARRVLLHRRRRGGDDGCAGLRADGRRAGAAHRLDERGGRANSAPTSSARNWAVATGRPRMAGLSPLKAKRWLLSPSSEIELIDLKAQQARIRVRIDAAIARVLDHGPYIMGPEVSELEERLARLRSEARDLLRSGTDALLIALMALDIGPAMRCICPAFTYTATPEVIALLGATPVFVDVRSETFNIDPAGTEAGSPPHVSGARSQGDHTGRSVWFGRRLRPDPCRGDAQPYVPPCRCRTIFGATYRDRCVGSLGDVTATSFFPAKPLGCYGDGGAIFTDDDDLANAMRSIRLHGKGSDKYDIVRIGVNGRLDTIQAAILIEKLEVFADEIERRDVVAARYTKALHGRVGLPEPPAIRDLTSLISGVWSRETGPAKPSCSALQWRHDLIAKT